MRPKLDNVYSPELDGIYRSGRKNFFYNRIDYSDIPCKILGEKGQRYLIRLLEPTATKFANEEILVLKKNVRLVQDVSVYRRN